MKTVTASIATILTNGILKVVKSVRPDWATFVLTWKRFLFKIGPNIYKPVFLHKNCFGSFLGIVGEN